VKSKKVVISQGRCSLKKKKKTKGRRGKGQSKVAMNWKAFPGKRSNSDERRRGEEIRGFLNGPHPEQPGLKKAAKKKKSLPPIAARQQETVVTPVVAILAIGVNRRETPNIDGKDPQCRQRGGGGKKAERKKKSYPQEKKSKKKEEREKRKKKNIDHSCIYFLPINNKGELEGNKVLARPYLGWVQGVEKKSPGGETGTSGLRSRKPTKPKEEEAGRERKKRRPRTTKEKKTKKGKYGMPLAGW